MHFREIWELAEYLLAEAMYVNQGTDFANAWNEAVHICIHLYILLYIK